MLARHWSGMARPLFTILLTAFLLLTIFPSTLNAARTAGEPCSLDADCEDALYCILTDSVPTCAERLHPGASCNRPRMCATDCAGTTCTLSLPGQRCAVDDDCSTKNCEGTTCSSKGKDGASCAIGHDEECIDDLFCSDTGSCIGRFPVGTSCGRPRQCTTNVCSTTCIASSLVGKCYTNADCASPLTCSGGECHYPTGAEVPTASATMGSWLPAAAAALLVSFLLVALAYMIGVGFKYRHVEQWSKAELWEAVLSAVMIGFVFFLVQFVGDMSYVLVGQNHFSAAQAYLDATYGQLTNNWMALMATMEILGFTSSLAISTFIPIPLIPFPPGATVSYLRLGINISPMAGWSAITSGLAAPLYLVYFAILSNIAQSILLLFSQRHMLETFLPMGLLFRAFPLTRRIGGTVIALALALYFVFPLSLALNMYVYNLYAVPGGEVITGTDVPHNLVGNPWDVFTSTTEVFMPFLRHLFFFVVLVVFFFILDIIITITAFRAIAEAIGGDPQIFGMGKLGI